MDTLEYLPIILNIAPFIILLPIGYFIGRYIEKLHYRQILIKETTYQNILIFNERKAPDNAAGQPFGLVMGSVVISSDYFKTFLASIRGFFGGRLTPYESLLDRARREAIIRMKEAAHRNGFNAIFNVRFETANLKGNIPQKGQLMCAEFIAYGTAWRIPT